MYCKKCERDLTDNTYRVGPDGEMYCHDCFADDFVTCEKCSAVIRRGSETKVYRFTDDDIICADDIICLRCLDEYEHCRECDGWFRRNVDLVRYGNDEWVCWECYRESYFTCITCDHVHETFEMSDESGICINCYNSDNIDDHDINEDEYGDDIHEKDGIFVHNAENDRILSDPDSEI